MGEITLQVQLACQEELRLASLQLQPLMPGFRSNWQSLSEDYTEMWAGHSRCWQESLVQIHNILGVLEESLRLWGSRLMGWDGGLRGGVGTLLCGDGMESRDSNASCWDGSLS